MVAVPISAPSGDADRGDALGDAPADFGAWLLERHYAPRTRRVYLGYVRRASAFVTKTSGRRLWEASFEDLRDFWRSVPDSSASRNQARKALVAYFTWARIEGLADASPALALESLPAPSRLPRPFPGSGLERILDAGGRLGGLHEAIASLYGLTGCRFSEGRLALWVDVELEGDAPGWYIEGKGSRRRGPKRRRVDLREDLVDVLTGWRRRSASDYVFSEPGDPSLPMTEHHLRVAFRELFVDAALDSAVPHRIRHSVGTRLYEETGDLRIVQEVLGHASVSTSELYTLVTGKRTRGALEALPRARRPGEDDTGR